MSLRFVSSVLAQFSGLPGCHLESDWPRFEMTEETLCNLCLDNATIVEKLMSRFILVYEYFISGNVLIKKMKHSGVF